MNPNITPYENNPSNSITNANHLGTPLQAKSSRFKVINPESVMLSEVVKFQNLTSTVQKNLLITPMLLNPCGHTVSYNELDRSLRATKEKRCPDCAKVYTFAVDHLFFNKFINSVKLNILQNSPLYAQIQAEIEKLPDTGKTKFKEIFELFLKGGESDNAIKQICMLMITTADHNTFMPIFKLCIKLKIFYSNSMLASFNKISKPPQTATPLIQTPPAHAIASIPSHPSASATSSGTTPPNTSNTPSSVPFPAVNKTQTTPPAGNCPSSVESITEYEKLKFLQVVQLADLICPLTQSFMQDPYQLVPCGHTFNKQGILDFYTHKRNKICAVCASPYTSIIQNLFLKNVVCNYLLCAAKPKRDIHVEIYNEFKKLPQEERQNLQLNQNLRSFLTGLPISKNEILELALNSSNSDIFLTVLTIMDQYTENARNDFKLLVNETLEASSAVATNQNPSDSSMNQPLLTNSSSSSAGSESAGDSLMEVDNAQETLDFSPTSSAFSSVPDSASSTSVPTLKRHLTQPDLPQAKKGRLISKDNEQAPLAHQGLTDTAPLPSAINSGNSSSVSSTSTTTSSTTTSTITTQTAPSSSAPPADNTEQENTPEDIHDIQSEDNDKQTEDTEDLDLTLINKLKSSRKQDCTPWVNERTLFAVDKKGNTPLHLMVKKYTIKSHIFKEIVNYSINYNAQNKKGQTPLHIAARSNNPIMIKFLLENGASLDLEDNKGRRPLDLAKTDEAKKALKA